MSEQSRGINVPDPRTYGGSDGTRTGIYRSSSHQFDVEPGSFASALGTMLWSSWQGICDSEPVDAVEELTIAGRVVDAFACESLRGSAMVWLDRETSLVLRVDAEDLVGLLPGSGLVLTLTGLSGFSVVQIDYEPAFAADEFTLRPPPKAAENFWPPHFPS